MVLTVDEQVRFEGMCSTCKIQIYDKDWQELVEKKKKQNSD